VWAGRWWGRASANGMLAHVHAAPEEPSQHGACMSRHGPSSEALARQRHASFKWKVECPSTAYRPGRWQVYTPKPPSRPVAPTCGMVRSSAVWHQTATGENAMP